MFLDSPRSIAQKLVNWFRKHARDLPWRRTHDAYAVWISEVMLQQTQVKTVIPYWERWMKLFPNAESLMEAPEASVLKAWEGLGYYSRARNLQKAASYITRELNGVFPSVYEEMLKLPGVGRYTAGAVCSIAFNQATAILDGNVARVLSRIYLVDGDIKEIATRKKLWELSGGLVKEASEFTGRGCSDLNQSLMELGAVICTPKNPLCGECPVRGCCKVYENGAVERYPQSAPRQKTKQRLHFAFVMQKNRSVLIRQREAGQVNAGFWEFPNFEVVKSQPFGKQIKKFLCHDPGKIEPWHSLKHSITTSRITLRAYKLELNGEAGSLKKALRCEWRKIVELEKLPFTGAHSKLRSLLLAGV